ncbi:MAG TPA: AAA family ATPase [Polyangiaceae bacterium]|jgi:predicted ATPase
MNRPHLERLHVRNYGCIKDLELKLTPLHALIGPNDSGKSTALMALRTLSTLAAGPLAAADDSGKLLAALRLNRELSLDGGVGHETWTIHYDGTFFSEANKGTSQPITIDHGSNLVRREPALAGVLRRSILLRLEPDSLRMPTELIAEGQPLGFLNALGLGLPAVYDAIVTRDLNAYRAINDRLAVLYPAVKSLSLKNPTRTTKALGIQLHDGTFVGADFMSEGMLYFLAYAALPYLEPAALILIEEPENGLHPARIKEVMRILREISQTTQVVLATHSPLVINELEPDEVTVLTRKPDVGTKGTLLKDTPNFAERSKVYALGELWVSYADGDFEEPLFKEPHQAPESSEPVDWSESDKA